MRVTVLIELDLNDAWLQAEAHRCKGFTVSQVATNVIEGIENAAVDAIIHRDGVERGTIKSVSRADE